VSVNSAPHLFDLSGRTALITGGGGVLGSAIARALAQCGARVIVLGRTQATLERVVTSLQAKGARAAWAVADVIDAAAVAGAVEALGEIHILVNAAGGNKAAAITSPARSMFELDLQAMNDVMQLNWMGTVIPSFVVAKQMAARGEGVLINIASMTTYKPLTRTVAYSSAKAAVGNFTQWLAAHVAMNYSPRIRVNAIAPGFFVTDQNRPLLYEPDSNELSPRGRSIIAHTPMGRFGAADELGGTAIWLASEASQFVTGVVIPVDGGFQAFSGV
jgi:NAD(P)-dependent dehydrogenase (short-subunit alcohol dehydrogenase family)